MTNINARQQDAAPRRGRRRRRRRRGGAVMVEFAIVCFLLYLIMAAVFTFGRALFVAQALQQATDTFAHELARTPLPANADFADADAAHPAAPALADPVVRQTLFDEDQLRIDITPWVNNGNGQSLLEYLDAQKIPLINRLLVPTMIVDREGAQTFLWYPGAEKEADGHFYVNVLAGDGTKPPAHVRVVEPMPVTDPTTGQPVDPFPVGAGGLAAVRINYPFQSSSFSAVTYAVNGAPVQGIPVGEKGVANTWVQANGEAPYMDNPDRGGLYAGPNHLGQQAMGGKIVRPFQRLISTQAAYRRELFN